MCILPGLSNPWIDRGCARSILVRYFGNILQRVRQFDSTSINRPDETITLTHLKLGYELNDKQGHYSLTIDNLFDRSFNWVTSPYDTSGETPERTIQFSITLNL